MGSLRGYTHSAHFTCLQVSGCVHYLNQALEGFCTGSRLKYIYHLALSHSISNENFNLNVFLLFLGSMCIDCIS